MTLVSSRVALTHRLTILRDANLGDTDEWGTAAAADFEPHLVDVPCRTWVTAGHASGDTAVDATNIIVVAGRHAIIPLGTDVTETDRVGDITYRGDTILEGPMGIQSILQYPDHLELTLRRVK